MANNYALRRHGGHAPGHVRDTFLNAVSAFEIWDGKQPEPMIEHEVNYQPVEISLSQACGLVWNCTDQLPGGVVAQLEECGLSLRSGSYAADARALRRWIRGRPRLVSI
jgi:hypothetical protein